jgi:hypothetical protein
VISDYTLNGILAEIYRQPALYGCQVLYVGPGRAMLLRGGYQVTNNYYTIVVIEELSFDAPAPKTLVKYNQQFQGDELKGGVINCGMTVVSVLGIIGGAAGEVPSGGLSTLAIYAGYAGLVANGAQCINSIVRTTVAYEDPLGQQLQSWDSNQIYQWFTTIVDIVGLATSFASIAGEAKNIREFLVLRGSLASEEKLAAMTNRQRISAYENAVKKVSGNRYAATEFKNLLASMGSSGRRISGGNTVIIRHDLGGLGKLIEDRTLDKLAESVKNVLTSATSIGMNGLPSEYVGSASGTMNKAGNLIFHVIPPAAL